MNSVNLIGRLTRDPELRYTESGVAVTNFNLAVDRPFKNANGDTETDFPGVVCWKALAELVAEHMRKGRLVGVSGRMQTRNYEGADGKTVYVTEVVAEHIKFLDRSPEQEQGNQNTGNNQRQSNNRGGNNQGGRGNNRGR